MIPLQSLFRGGRAGLILALRLGRYLIIFLFGICQPKAVLVAKVLALQSQLASCKDRIERRESPKPRFDPAFRLLWVALSKMLDGWEEWAFPRILSVIEERQQLTPEAHVDSLEVIDKTRSVKCLLVIPNDPAIPVDLADTGGWLLNDPSPCVLDVVSTHRTQGSVGKVVLLDSA